MKRAAASPVVAAFISWTSQHAAGLDQRARDRTAAAAAAKAERDAVRKPHVDRVIAAKAELFDAMMALRQATLEHDDAGLSPEDLKKRTESRATTLKHPGDVKQLIDELPYAS